MIIGFPSNISIFIFEIYHPKFGFEFPTFFLDGKKWENPKKRLTIASPQLAGKTHTLLSPRFPTRNRLFLRGHTHARTHAHTRIHGRSAAAQADAAAHARTRTRRQIRFKTLATQNIFVFGRSITSCGARCLQPPEGTHRWAVRSQPRACPSSVVMPAL